MTKCVKIAPPPLKDPPPSRDITDSPNPGPRTEPRIRNDATTGTGEFDAVARPKHYNAQVPPTDKHPNGIECIDVTMHFDNTRGSAMKYIWRAGEKGDFIEDLDKSIAYLEFAKYKEQQRRKREIPGSQNP